MLWAIGRVGVWEWGAVTPNCILFCQEGCKAWLIHQLEPTPARDLKTFGASPSSLLSLSLQVQTPPPNHHPPMPILGRGSSNLGPTCHQLPGKGRPEGGSATRKRRVSVWDGWATTWHSLCGSCSRSEPGFLLVSPESGRALRSRGHLLPPSGVRGAWPWRPAFKEPAVLCVPRLESTVKLTGEPKASPPGFQVHPKPPLRLCVPGGSLVSAPSAKHRGLLPVSCRHSQCSVAAQITAKGSCLSFQAAFRDQQAWGP